jgi:hypothetical protein
MTKKDSWVDRNNLSWSHPFHLPAKNAMLEINLMKPWKSLVGFVSNVMTTGLFKRDPWRWCSWTSSLIQIFDHHSAPHNSTFILEKQEEETLVKKSWATTPASHHHYHTEYRHDPHQKVYDQTSKYRCCESCWRWWSPLHNWSDVKEYV